MASGRTATSPSRVGLFAAVSIGVGGMIGAGIFSILGVVATISGSALAVSFAVGGVVAALAAYSYAKLGSRYPSSGGSVQFLVEGLGDGVLTGTLNVFQYIAYVISIALYAARRATWPNGIDILFGAGVLFIGYEGFGLITNAGVNIAHLRVRHETGARPAIIIASCTACVVMFVLLIIYIVGNAPAAAWITLVATLVVSYVIEVLYRRRSGRRFRRMAEQSPATT